MQRSRRRWAEGYLSGMARAHARGNVPERSVRGAVTLALMRGVDAATIGGILAQHHLAWDATASCVRRMDAVPAEK